MNKGIKNFFPGKMKLKNKFVSNKTTIVALLLSPTGILIALLILFPMGYAFFISLHKVNLVGGEFDFVLIGLKNYAYMLDDPRFLPTLVQSIQFTVLRVIVSIFLGMAVAMVLNEASMASRILKYLFLIPWALSFVMNGLMWSWMYNAEYGVINEILTQLNIIASNHSWLGTRETVLGAVVVADAWKSIPFVALVILAGLKSISEEQYEASKVDGASLLQRFFRITLPNLRPVILVTLVIQTMWSLKTFATVWVTTKGGPNDASMLLNIYAYQQSFMFYNFGYGAAVAFVVTILILLITIAYITLLQIDD